MAIREAGKMREIIVFLEPDGSIGFKAKGLSQIEWLTVGACYHAAVKARVAEEQRAKKRK